MLNPDDFDVNLFFTVLNDNATETSVHALSGGVNTVQLDRYHKGGVYQITGINLPFISYRYHTCEKITGPCHGSLDTREVDLIKLDRAYLVARASGLPSLAAII